MWPALAGERVLSHKYPDNMARVRALLAQSSAPFRSRHRIRTTSGEILKVAVVGDAVTDQDGRMVATRGFYIDITDRFTTDLQDSVGEEMEMSRAHREAQVSRTTTPLGGCSAARRTGRSQSRPRRHHASRRGMLLAARRRLLRHWEVSLSRPRSKGRDCRLSQDPQDRCHLAVRGGNRCSIDRPPKLKPLNPNVFARSAAGMWSRERAARARRG
jgi:hypothetical protein